MIKDEILARRRGQSIEDVLTQAIQILNRLKPVPAIIGVFRVERFILPSLPEVDIIQIQTNAKKIPRISLVFGNPSEIDDMISAVERAVKNGEIPEERIDRSIIRIMNAKGINVV